MGAVQGDWGGASPLKTNSALIRTSVAPILGSVETPTSVRGDV